MRKEFGFYPEPMRIDAWPIRIRTLPNHGETIRSVLAEDEVENGWRYAPPQQVRSFPRNEVRSLPYSSRIFPLPKTHSIEHTNCTRAEQLEFHLWSLSFFQGIRLTTTDAGFLDATPVKKGKLVDFVLTNTPLERVFEIAEDFWQRILAHEAENPRRFTAAIHALFLSQYPHALIFERFIYLYTALDASFRVTKSLHGVREHIPHKERIEWMCNRLGIPTPVWARSAGTAKYLVAAIRNAALHEALFLDEPFGFSSDRATSKLVHEMKALACRVLVALVGGCNTSYLESNLNDRQRCGLTLRR